MRFLKVGKIIKIYITGIIILPFPGGIGECQGLINVEETLSFC